MLNSLCRARYDIDAHRCYRYRANHARTGQACFHLLSAMIYQHCCCCRSYNDNIYIYNINYYCDIPFLSIRWLSLKNNQHIVYTKYSTDRIKIKQSHGNEDCNWFKPTIISHHIGNWSFLNTCTFRAPEWLKQRLSWFYLGNISRGTSRKMKCATLTF